MTVPKSKRRTGRLEALVKAQDLATYTLRVTSNRNKFPAEYSPLSDEIAELGIRIFVDCHKANRLNLKSKFAERQALQQDALDCLENLLALMNLAGTVYHLDSRRVGRVDIGELGYWGQLAVDTINLIKKWKESDQSRV